ncbi:MAG: DUF5715 family protein [Terracidiphilus sp.]
MRRNPFIAFVLAAGVAACAAAQGSSSSQSTKPHHAKVHHPRTHHPAPTANPEANAHQQTMKEETAGRKRDSHTGTEGKSSLKSEKSVSSTRRAESAREARARRRNRVKPHSVKKHHASGSGTVGANRLERERRERTESKAGYEDGFRAGFAAGLAARRSEAASAYGAPPASRPGLRTLISRSTETAPEPAAQTHISDATVRSTTPISGNGAGGDVPEPARERSHSGPEKASLELPNGTHVAPISLRAALNLLHEPAPGPLRGTLASLERQNRRLDAEGLQRVEDEHDLDYRIARRLLVAVPVSGGLAVNPGLPADRRYCRPWTANFLTDLARMHEAVFHSSLRVDSAVRTVKYQRRLIAVNANAAPAVGDVASPHETGAAVDIAKRGMTRREIGWMRRYLLALQTAGLIDVEEEFYQSCFHITVYDSYGRRGVPREAGTGSGGNEDKTLETAAAPSGRQG